MKNLMKIKTFVIVLALQFIALFAISQTAKFNYQAVVRDNLGNPLVNAMVDIDVRILQGAVDGTEVFAENHQAETNAFGLVTLQVGSIEDLSVVDWSADTYFFEVTVDDELMGTSQLLSVPMAVSATYAENYDESDPLYSMAPASIITNDDINDWSAAYSWGDHSGLYLPSDYTPELEETDPLYSTAPASTITNDDISDWSTAYSWGDHSGLYLPSDYTPDYSNLVNLTDDQVIAGTKTFTGTVVVPTPVNEYDAVPKEYVDALLDRLLELELATGLKVQDIDGNLYSTVTLGTQVWMQENLKTTKYRNNTDIQFINDNATWNSNTDAAYCQAYHVPSNGDIYGNLYNWEAVNTGMLCPEGWHVPTSVEWQELMTWLEDNGFGYGGSGAEVAKSLSSQDYWYSGGTTEGTVGWQTHLNNSSTFDARPGAFMRGFNDTPGYEVYFWASNESNATNAYKASWTYYSTTPNLGTSQKFYGFSVRCLKD
ncbi:MAG: fibrobacter succinogenes major paralogous domain-containing protein [Bacteroidales bacterium]|nr:fibrobacter succinogenes major paralogous domain-containing protein [Bacteroidales bacterium]